MAVVKLYNVGFSKEQNCVLDSITDYLGSLTPVAQWTYKFIKQDLDISLKIPLNQIYSNNPTFNYVSILNEGESRTFYYYLAKPARKAQETIQLMLSCDTLNTFKDLLVFTNNTQIYRQHKDRFLVSGNTYTSFRRRIDKFSEIEGLVKYILSDTKYTLPNQQKWYLAYTNSNGSAEDNTSINCYLVPENELDSTFNPPTAYTIDNIEEPSYYFIVDNYVIVTYTRQDNTTGTLQISNDELICIDNDGTKLNIGTMRSVGTPQHYVNTFTIIESNIKSFLVSANCEAVLLNDYWYNYYNALSFSIVDVVKNRVDTRTTIFFATSTTLTSGTFSDINRTLSSIVRIIECPYIPSDYTDATVWQPLRTNDLSNDDSLYWIKLIDLNEEFETSLGTLGLPEFTATLPGKASRIGTLKNANYESKLYHSNFYNFNFVYDSFIKSVPLENITPNNVLYSPSLNLSYKQSNTLTSNLAFRFTIDTGVRELTENYENYLVCSRNNEVPLYNSSYLNYLRTGYNYDVKNKNTQNQQGWVSFGIQTVGAAASLIAGIATTTTGVGAGIGAAAIAGGVSLATSATASIASNIYRDVNQQNSIEQKIKETKAQANTVSGTDDLNLLNWYNGNILHYTKYNISNTIRNKVFELFYKTGYACDEIGIPNTATRYYFNFLQCKADFSTKNNPEWQEFINDVIVRFEKGVTYFHVYTDFEQTRENWEITLVE